jgi:hydroxyacylglutathione hydrolase
MQIEPLVVGAFEVNCYIITGTENQALVIDPGADADDIAAALQARGLTVAAYLMTHGHMDHISSLADMVERCPAPVLIHPDDAAWAFTEVNAMPPYYPVPKAVALEPLLLDGYETQLAGLSLRIIATPGHTPGGVCIYLPDHAALITGDTLFAGSVGRTDLPGGDSRVLAQSIKLLSELPEAVTIYPGHGESSTIGQEKRTNYFMQGGR